MKRIIALVLIAFTLGVIGGTVASYALDEPSFTVEVDPRV